MTEQTDISKLLPCATEIALEAGEAIKTIYLNSNYETSFKKDNSPLTTADKAAHDVIVTRLRNLTPEFPCLSEESRQVAYEDRKGWNVYWLVDPLDGTKEFIKKNGEFTVNIALIQSGRPVLGVVHAPILNKTYYAAEGEGAFLCRNGEAGARIKVADYRSRGLTIIASRSHTSEKVKKLLEEIKPKKIISMGSSLKICLVAEGEAHFYPRFGPTMEWDTAAAQAVLTEAGGSMTDLTGAELQYNKQDLLNPKFVVCGNPPYPWQELKHF